jgi:hypothetical protein
MSLCVVQHSRKTFLQCVHCRRTSFWEINGIQLGFKKPELKKNDHGVKPQSFLIFVSHLTAEVVLTGNSGDQYSESSKLE